jgi:hypothetical protein
MNKLISRESKSTTLKWSGGFVEIKMQRPDDYVLIDKSPATDKPYVYEPSDEYDNTDEAWAISFESDEFPETVVTHFPNRDGVKLTAVDSPSYKEGRRRAMFGLVMLAVIRSGARCMKEL